MTFIDVIGAEGGPYRFQLLPQGARVSPMGGEFLYVRSTPGGWTLLFAAESNNLSADAQSRWSEASTHHGADRLYTRLNVAASARGSELADILAHYDPPMNRDA